MTRHTLCALLLLLCSSSLLANNGKDYRFTLAPVSNELTQQWVRESFQDSRGFIWFLSQEGLNRYDGYQVRQYRHSPTKPGSISADTFTGIEEDSRGTLWISTLGGGLNRYHPESDSFTAVQHDPRKVDSPLSDQVWGLFADSNDHLWLGYDSGGFSRFDPESGQFTHYSQDTHPMVTQHAVGGFAETADGMIWVSTEGNGLLRINLETGGIRRYAHGGEGSEGQLNSSMLSGVMVDSLGRLWVSSAGGGVSMLPPGKHVFHHYRHNPEQAGSLPSDNVYNIMEDREGKLWFGSERGLAKLEDDGTFQSFQSGSSGLLNNRITSLSQSSDGIYWVGTMLGIHSGRKYDFLLHDTDTGLADNAINAFAETGDGTIWIATDKGLNRQRPGSSEFELIDHSKGPLQLPASPIMSLWGESEVLWVGTMSAGLHRLDLRNQRVDSFTHEPGDVTSLGADGVTAVRRDAQGRLWVATYGGGVNLLEETTGHFTRFRHDPDNPRSVSTDQVLAIYQEMNGTLWFGSEQGLNRYNEADQSFTRYQRETEQEDALSSQMVWAMHEDRQGSLWLGTQNGGVNRWLAEMRHSGTASFEHFSEDIGLPSSHIYGIESDRSGKLWMSHNQGITVLDPDTLVSRHLDVSDGLQDYEFNLGASFTDSSGQLYFGGMKGYNVIPADYVLASTEPPPVAVTGVRVMNKPVSYDASKAALPALELGYKEYLFSVDFAVMDFTNPARNRYMYKLSGFDSDWIDLKTQHTATFTNLPAGRYTLKVRAAGPSGTWNEGALNLPIRVLPAPWLSWWAKAAYAMLLLAVIASAVRRQQRRVANALLRQQELETKVAERTADLEVARKQAVEANQAKSAFLATMSHEIRTPMHGMLGMTELLLKTELSSQQKRYARTAHHSGEALLSLINSILDLSKLEASRVEIERVPFSLAEQLDELCYLESEPAARKGLNLNHIYSADLPEQVIGDPGKIRQVVINLVNNAIKFTAEGEINVRVSPLEPESGLSNGIQIEVEDTGIGMDAEAQKRVFEVFTQADASTTREFGGTGLGLAISRQYVELMGGSLVVSSEPGRGSTFRIAVPLPAAGAETTRAIHGPLRAALLCASGATTDMLTERLLRHGVDCFVASGAEALSYEALRSDLVIADAKSLLLARSEFLEELSAQTSHGFVLTSIASPTLPPALDSWSRLARPITTQALEEALDQVVGATASKADPSSTEIEPRRPVYDCRILVAEDVEVNQTIARDMLEMLGCQVTIAVNGKQAVEKFRQAHYDLVFMDCQMPVMDGYDATRSIRELEQANNREPVTVIALTAAMSRSDEDRCLAAGMSGYMAKPYSLNDLTRFLAPYARKHQAGQESSVVLLDQAREAASGHIVDRAVIDNLRHLGVQNGHNVFSSMYESFQQHMEEQLPLLETQVSQGTASELGLTAHYIKSASSCMGARAITGICDQIETLSAAGEVDTVKTLVSEMRQAYRDFRDLIEREWISEIG